MTLQRLTDAAPRPDPVIHPDTEAFWTGLRQGELRIQVCSRCGTYRFPLAPVCFRCLAFEHTWAAISPEGTVAVAVVVHRATGDPAWGRHVPFRSGLVDLEHGLRLPGRIVCTCGEALNRGARVRAVVLTSTGGVAVYAFAHACISPA